MWQRIQTLWWLLAMLAMGLFSTRAILLYTAAGELLPEYALHSYGVRALADGQTTEANYLVAILSGVSIALSAISILIYKMRTFQFRLSVLNCIVLLASLCAVGYLGYLVPEGVSVGITVWLSMPLVALILQLMAIRGVLKDEMLVRMSNRIR